MTAGKANSARRRVVVQAFLGLVVLGLFVFSAWYLTSPNFTDWVRGRVVSQLERATGGRVEMRGLQWNLSELAFVVDDLTIHGLEGPDELPYLHVNRLTARAKIVSLWQRDIGLHFARLEQPVFHLIVYPDGSTNQPTPKVRRERGKTPVEYLFDLTVGRAEVRDGLFLLNNRPIPIDFQANDLQASMTFDQAAQRFDGMVQTTKLDVKVRDLRPVSATLDARFSLFPKRLALNTVKISTGRSQVEASGSLDNFSSPELQLNYTAAVDLAEFGGVTRHTELRGGKADLNGKGRYRSAKDFASIGSLALKNLAFANGVARLSGTDMGANYSIDAKTLALADIKGRTLGGRFSGAATVTNWKTGNDRTTDPAVEQGTLKLSFQELSVARLAEAVSTRSLPLGRLNATGIVQASVNARWKGSPSNAVIEIVGSVVPPAQSSPGQLPVRAQVRGTYLAPQNVFEVAQAEMATPNSRLSARGAIGTRRANLRVLAESSHLGEFAPVIAALRRSEAMPVEVNGRASFDGVLSGTIGSPTVDGRVQIADFTSVLAYGPQNTVAGQQSPKTIRMHWDLLSASIVYSPTRLAIRNGVLKEKSAQVDVDGVATLKRGEFLETSPFKLHVVAQGASIGDLQRLAGVQYPVTGTANFNINVSGTQRDLQGSGKVVGTNLTVYGEPVQQVSSDVRFANREVQLRNFQAAQNGNRMEGFGDYNLTNGAFRFKLDGKSIDLASVRKLQTGFPVRGMLTFSATGSGTKDAPSVDADIQLRNLVASGEPLGDMKIDALTKGEILTLTARSNFKTADLRADGTVVLRGDFPTKLSVQMKQVDVDPVLRSVLKGRVTGHSALEGSVQAEGPLRTPQLMKVNGLIHRFAVELENIGLQNDGPIEFSMENQVARVKRLRIVGDGTAFTASGSFGVAGDRKLDLAAQGRLNLKILQSINPDFVSYGSLRLNAQVGGTMANPAVQGELNISDAGVSYIDLPNGLAEINGTLVFNENRLNVRQLTAKTGGGTLNVGGFVAYGRTVGFNMQAKAQDIRLRYPPGISSMANGDLRLSGTLNNALLSGDVTITKFALNPKFDFALYVARSKQPLPTPDPKSLLNNVKLDLHVTSAPGLQVQTSLAKVSGNVDLNVRGSATRPAVLGRINILEGDVFFNGTKYHVERGDILFSNPTGIKPVFDVEANTTVRNYDISLGFHGEIEKLNITYRSDPPLPSSDIVQLLAFGQTQQGTAFGSTPQMNFSESASDVLLSQALNTAVSSRVQRLFGVTRLKIDPRVGGAENNPSGAKVTVEQQVANNVTITYITDLTRATQQVIQVEYNVNRNVSIIGIRDETGVVSIDVRLRQRRR